MSMVLGCAQGCGSQVFKQRSPFCSKTGDFYVKHAGTLEARKEEKAFAPLLRTWCVRTFVRFMPPTRTSSPRLVRHQERSGTLNITDQKSPVRIPAFRLASGSNGDKFEATPGVSVTGIPAEKLSELVREASTDKSATRQRDMNIEPWNLDYFFSPRRPW